MISSISITPCGDDALRLTVEQTDQRYAIADALRNCTEWLEVVLGRESVTVQYNPECSDYGEALACLKQALVGVEETPPRVVNPKRLKVRTNPENAPDLERVAGANGMSVSNFLNHVQSSSLQVDMLGFAPGFSYVSGVDTALKGARLSHPRQHVPAGSVGFIEGFLGIYALDGPGGWPIIGHTETKLFDPAKRQPFLIQAGMPIIIEWQHG